MIRSLWLMGLLSLFGAMPSAATGPGVHLDMPPDRLGLEPEGPATLAALRSALAQGDALSALRTAEQFVASAPRGRERTAVHLLIGMLHRGEGRHNLASEAFTRVRQADGPLAEWGAYYEAEQDFARGRTKVAVSECARYRKRWPKGHHSGDCLRLIALGQARSGQIEAARASASAYDEDHRLGPIGQQVELLIARNLLDEGRGAEARPILQTLALTHEAPLTGRVAEAWLAELRDAGDALASIPEGRNDQVVRAIALRDARRRDDAWEAFAKLLPQASDDPDLMAFVEEETERFGWRTHRWDHLAEVYAAQYEADGEPKWAWKRYRVLDRGGRYAEAAEYAMAMQRKHRTSREWRRAEEDIGRTLMMAGRYAEAVKQFDAVAGRGGWSGRRGRFFAGFASLMAGDAKDATRRFTGIIKDDRAWVTEARYWRARAYGVLDQSETAADDYRWIVENEPDSWYAVLVQQRDPSTPVMAPFARSGQWAGFPEEESETWLTDVRPTPPPSPPTVPISAVFAPRAGAPRDGLASLTWPFGTSSHQPVPPATAPSAGITLGWPEQRPPESYRACSVWNPDEGRAALARFTDRFDRYWPELAAINDLATVGLYDLSGPLMSEWYEQWRREYRRRYRNARRVKRMKTPDWRELFLAARDHHHASRFSYGLWEDLPQRAQTERDALQRLAYPLAHDHVVWQASRAHGVDPFLVLGLMRQESTYRATAVSRVGARGAMQIMPRTGHLLADLLDDTSFTAGDLEDPIVSVGYGIRYLGLLLKRFDGAFPLAVASYNGGPFNVSTWLSGTGQHLPMDAFVEHIPFRETRDYVKRVTAGYARYVSLYGPSDARVVVPAHPRGDHPEVVDF